MATLLVLAGLPGTGKTTLARNLARSTGAVHLRIDTIEQALRDLCGIAVMGEGYRLAYRVAVDNLRLGLDVVADSCNPIELTRREWEDVARSADALCVNVEVVCSDEAEHRRRVETRPGDIAGLVPPTWDAVVAREYHEWTVPRIVVDTSARSEAESLSALLDAVAASCED